MMGSGEKRVQRCVVVVMRIFSLKNIAQLDIVQLDIVQLPKAP